MHRRYMLEPDEDRVVAYIKDNPRSSHKNVAAGLDMAAEYVSEIFRSLAKKGVIRINIIIEEPPLFPGIKFSST